MNELDCVTCERSGLPDGVMSLRLQVAQYRAHRKPKSIGAGRAGLCPHFLGSGPPLPDTLLTRPKQEHSINPAVRWLSGNSRGLLRKFVLQV